MGHIQVSRCRHDGSCFVVDAGSPGASHGNTIALGITGRICNQWVGLPIKLEGHRLSYCRSTPFRWERPGLEDLLR